MNPWITNFLTLVISCHKSRVGAREARQWTCPRFISVVCGSPWPKKIQFSAFYRQEMGLSTQDAHNSFSYPGRIKKKNDIDMRHSAFLLFPIPWPWRDMNSAGWKGIRVSATIFPALCESLTFNKKKKKNSQKNPLHQITLSWRRLLSNNVLWLWRCSNLRVIGPWIVRPSITFRGGGPNDQRLRRGNGKSRPKSHFLARVSLLIVDQFPHGYLL